MQSIVQYKIQPVLKISVLHEYQLIVESHIICFNVRTRNAGFNKQIKGAIILL